MARDVFVTCAVTGGGDTVKKSPAVPVTPAQIADSALEAAAAGAAVVHIHVRDPQTGKPSMDGVLYSEVLHRVRAVDADVLVNMTTGAGARFMPSLERAGLGEKGTMLSTPAERVRHIVELRPEICSLDIATMNFGEHAFLNTPTHIRAMARAITEIGTIPELEVFELGHIRLARALISEGSIPPPHFFQLCLGVPWGAEADAETLRFMVSRLPAGVVWSAFGVGAAQFPMVAATIDTGGHVRVGLEDNLYLERGVLAPDNASLVKRAVAMIRASGHRVASPSKAREILRGKV